MGPGVRGSGYGLRFGGSPPELHVEFDPFLDHNAVEGAVALVIERGEGLRCTGLRFGVAEFRDTSIRELPARVQDGTSPS